MHDLKVFLMIIVNFKECSCLLENTWKSLIRNSFVPPMIISWPQFYLQTSGSFSLLQSFRDFFSLIWKFFLVTVH